MPGVFMMIVVVGVYSSVTVSCSRSVTLLQIYVSTCIPTWRLFSILLHILEGDDITRKISIRLMD